jgi:hypothetical protein
LPIIPPPSGQAGVSGREVFVRIKFLAVLVVLFASVLPPAHVVRAADPVPTTTTLTSSANPAKAGHAVTLTATVSDASGGGATPTGTVTFRAFDRGTLGTVALVGGKATLHVALSAGVHSVGAGFDGSESFFPSGASITQRWGGQVRPTVLLSGFPNPAPEGFPVTLTAGVRPAEGTGAATGSVTFRDGATVLAIVALGSPDFDEGGLTASASFTASGLSAGTHSLTADYAGDGNLLAGTCSPDALVIGQPITTETHLDQDSGSSVAVAGRAALFSASVFASGIGSRPGGTVSLVEGTTVLATAPAASGFLSVFGLAAGAHQVFARYEGAGATFAPSVSAVETVTVVDAGGPSPSVVTWAPDPASVAFGQSVTITATVAADPRFPAAGSPTGTVAFWSSGAVVGTVPVDASGAAAITFQPRAGASVTPVYSGDATFAAAIGTPAPFPAPFLFVGTMPTTTTVTSGQNPVPLGRPVTFTAHVTPSAVASPGLSGTVAFMDGFLNVGRAVLDATGTATLTLSLPADRHTIGARYDGNRDYSSSQASLTQTVLRQRATDVALASSRNPSGVGQKVRLTATVTSPAPAGETPGGTVTFLDGSTVLGRAKLHDGGVASLDVERLAAGSHALTAVYGGDAVYAAGASGVLTQVVTA